MDCVKFRIIHIGTLSVNKFWGETERRRAGCSTCTLLESNGKRVLVDPSPGAEELGSLLLARAGLQPEDIDMVFVTHFHGDHRFGLELFAGKPWLMARVGLEDWRERVPQDAELVARFEAAEGRLPEGVSLLPSPGHTAGHCSLVAETEWGRLVVAGDAVMTQEYFEAEEGFHNSVDAGRAVKSCSGIPSARRARSESVRRPVTRAR
jgi:glyoxylase-like metal-dependent hydrolase (beta-lactamase superfamily II)